MAYEHFNLPPKETALSQTNLTRDIFDVD